MFFAKSQCIIFLDDGKNMKLVPPDKPDKQ
jgi:hypothetical protein